MVQMAEVHQAFPEKLRFTFIRSYVFSKARFDYLGGKEGGKEGRKEGGREGRKGVFNHIPCKMQLPASTIVVNWTQFPNIFHFFPELSMDQPIKKGHMYCPGCSMFC